MITVTATVTDSTGASGSDTASATIGNGMVAGTAVGRYPNQPAGSAAAYLAHHESLFGDVPCLRTYTGPTSQMPASWSGHSDRWTWQSFKPSYTRFTQSNIAGNNPGYADVMNFLDTIPDDDGMIRIITPHHETDVGSKIPDTIPNQSLAKQTWWVFCKAIHDHGHPLVLSALVAGSKDTLTRSGGLGLNPIINATWGGLSVAASTDALRDVVDVMGWDPYNIASQDGNYAANRQDPPFFFDPIVDWTLLNFPDARIAVAETGYRPNQANLSMRPTWLNAMRDYWVAQNALALLYFDTVVDVDKQNWLGLVVTPRSPGTTNPYTFPAGTTFPPDTGTINAWSQTYADFPCYPATAAQLSNIR